MKGKVRVAFSILILVLIAAYFAWNTSQRKENSAYVSENQPVEIFFTRSGMHPERKLVSFIKSAKKYVYVAIFELDLEDVVNALIETKKRGVDVKIVMDDRMKKKWAAKKLKSAGIPIVFDEREAYMHNKFVVVDGRAVWSGSMNFKESSVYKNDNNAFIIFSPAVARNYEKEFKEMFYDRRFGPKSPRNTHCCFKVADIYLENYFSPEDNVGKRIESIVRKAKKNIEFAAFAFTDKKIGKAILDASKRGVKVVGVIESRSATYKGSMFKKFKKDGLRVLKDRNPYNMHNKYIIVDDSIVITGSYNFSSSARRKNDENVVIFFKPWIAKEYKKDFERILREAEGKR